MTLTAQAIMRAKTRKSTADIGPGSTILDQANPKTIRNTQVCTGADWLAVVKSWPEDWQNWWAERAAIMEFDGNLPREQAERVAYDNTLEAMSR